MIFFSVFFFFFQAKICFLLTLIVCLEHLTRPYCCPLAWICKKVLFLIAWSLLAGHLCPAWKGTGLTAYSAYFGSP